MKKKKSADGKDYPYMSLDCNDVMFNLLKNQKKVGQMRIDQSKFILFYAKFC